MRIALLCATRRGYRFLKKLVELEPHTDLVVFSFREEPHEPPFFADIRDLALSRGARFFETKKVGSQRWAPFWESVDVDLMLAVSWRYMVPREAYRRPRLGTYVFHDSLLPEYRGFSPTVWAIINGEDHTGVTLFEIAEEVDAGDIVDQERVPISAADTIAEVIERVTQTYLALLERNLPALISGAAPRHAQDHARATYTCRRAPEDNRIDWTAPSSCVFNLIRAVTRPYPGAYTFLQGRVLRIWSAERLHNFPTYVGRIPGRVVEVRPGDGSVVLTGDGALLLKQVQLEDGEPVNASKALDRLGHTLT